MINKEELILKHFNNQDFFICILDLAVLIGLSFVSVKVMMVNIIHQMAQINRQSISYRDMRGIGGQTKAGQDPETSSSGKL